MAKSVAGGILRVDKNLRGTGLKLGGFMNEILKFYFG